MAVKIFSELTNDDTGKLSSRISEGLFTSGVGEINTFFTASSQVTLNGEYEIDVYQEATSSITSEVQFSISYGHIAGSGSIVSDDEKPTKAIYSQYRNLILEPTDTKFTVNGVDTDHIVVLNFKRSRFKENIDPGNWQLKLTSGSNTITVIDDSGESLGTTYNPGVSASGKKFYNIVSGTIANGPSGSTPASYAYYGLLYHELGLLVFNPDAINTGLKMGPLSQSFLTQSSTTVTPNNNTRMFNLISGSLTNVFKARNEETLNSQHIFVRVKSKEYNFSTNPTYVTGSQGRIIDTISRRGVPFSYITSVGLYNDENQLLAVAKLSKPLLKEPGTEALLKIRLDF